MSVYRYLNQDPKLMVSTLAEKIAEMQPRASATQWEKSIQALTQKGVKGLEIQESGLSVFFSGIDDPNEKIERETILEWLERNTPTIKEVVLDPPRFKSASHASSSNGLAKYSEHLYVLNMEADNINDRLHEIQFEIEELGFDRKRLAEDPSLVMRLVEERTALMKRLLTAKGHTRHHFGSIKDPETNEPFKNLVGWVRVSKSDGWFFIDEIQSDWAQRGRRYNWENPDYPPAPFVQTTEAWSGMLLRRAMQRAAEDPSVEKCGWIKGSMSNGSWQESPPERAHRMDDFYLKILPKIANKALAGTGEKIAFTEMSLFPGAPIVTVPAFTMTDAVREKLLKPQPLYSKDVAPKAELIRTESQYRALKEALLKAHEMLGSTASIRLATYLIDEANALVAGRQSGRLIEVSLAARDPVMAINHESWHYADQYLLGPGDRAFMDRAFAPGTRLNRQVRNALKRDGASTVARLQCDNAKDACAHAFSLWMKGKFVLIEDEPQTLNRATTLFERVGQAFKDLHRWIHRLAGNRRHDRSTVNAIFSSLRDGRLAPSPTAAQNHTDNGQESVLTSGFRPTRERQCG